jgi:hypothetical protein
MEDVVKYTTEKYDFVLEDGTERPYRKVDKQLQTYTV